MKRYVGTLVLFAVITMLGCVENAMVTPDWQVTAPRIVALTADTPVFAPGDTVTFSALVVGIEMSKRASALAEWRLGNTLQSVQLDRAAAFTIPVAEDIDLFFGAAIEGDYIARGSAKVSVALTVRLADGSTLSARKDFLLAKPSVKAELAYRNPEIDRILVTIPGEAGLSLEPGETVSLPAGLDAERIGLSVALIKNDEISWYRYRWYVEPTPMEEVSLSGSAASSSIEISVPRLAPVMVHLVVEDASEENKETRYHGGVATLSFMVTIGSGSDEDVLPTDEDVLLSDE